jgi:hypothetical protein
MPSGFGRSVARPGVREVLQLAARGGQVGDERREAPVLVLRGLRRLGELDRARVAAAARGLRVAERTVWRWLAESDRGDIGRKPLSALLCSAALGMDSLSPLRVLGVLVVGAGVTFRVSAKP